jgi:hypothetical protein
VGSLGWEPAEVVLLGLDAATSGEEPQEVMYSLDFLNGG